MRNTSDNIVIKLSSKIYENEKNGYGTGRDPITDCEKENESF